MTFVGLIFIVVGAGIVIRSLWDIWDAIASRGWPATEGVVVVSDSVGWFQYHAEEVAYRYSVGGKELVATNVRFGDWAPSSWSRPLIRLSPEYPAGSVVTVHYNPEEPSQAVLEPGLTWFMISSFVFGMVSLLIGIVAIHSWA